LLPAWPGHCRRSPPDEIGRQWWQPVGIVVGPALLDFDAIAFDEPKFA
jgi:hypothetical protein